MAAVNFKKARSELSSLIRRAEQGEKIIISRRGKKVAQIVPLKKKWSPPPSLKDFRSSLLVKGKAISKTVADLRDEERY